MSIALALAQHEIGRNALPRGNSRRRPLHRLAHVFTVVICAMALAGCCITRRNMTRGSVISQPAYSKKVAVSKKFTRSKSRTPIPAAALISQPAQSEKVTESIKSSGAKSRTPIPLPAMPLLDPQPEPSCEVKTSGSNADERQRLDYERQCYRHAEMIVRSRLQLLQGSIDKTISASKGSPIPLPAASLLSPQPEPVCETTDTYASERQKLDYERQCYRHAEMIVRDRLQLLQRSVDTTIGAVKRGARGGL
jgi:hypothetical protein